MKNFNVITECYIDTNLVEYLLNDVVNHQGGCNEVMRTLNNKKNIFAIGVIDDDKRVNQNVNNFVTINQSEKLILMKHKERCQYLIRIKPAADMFILNCAKEEYVDTNQFGIPSELKAFTELSKSVSSGKDSRFKALFKELKNNKDFVALKRILKYLCEKQYKVNDMEVSNYLG